jgi:hypothetical protein
LLALVIRGTNALRLVTAAPCPRALGSRDILLEHEVGHHRVSDLDPVAIVLFDRGAREEGEELEEEATKCEGGGISSRVATF